MGHPKTFLTSSSSPSLIECKLTLLGRNECEISDMQCMQTDRTRRTDPSRHMVMQAPTNQEALNYLAGISSTDLQPPGGIIYVRNTGRESCDRWFLCRGQYPKPVSTLHSICFISLQQGCGQSHDSPEEVDLSG